MGLDRDGHSKILDDDGQDGGTKGWMGLREGQKQQKRAEELMDAKTSCWMGHRGEDQQDDVKVTADGGKELSIFKVKIQ
jgi:hypothetical protein